MARSCMACMACLAWLAIVCVVVTVAPAVARADDPNTEAAQIHFKAGEQYYLRGLYTEAIAEFKEAYRLSKAPALLYNMSQAYERAGDLTAARENLKKYMDSGETEPGELPALREKLANLDRRIADSKKTAPPPTTTTTTPPITTPAQPPPRVEPAPVVPIAPSAPIADQAPARPLRTWKWVVGGVGVGSLALSALFAVDAKKQEHTIEDAAGKTPPAPYTTALQDAYDRGKRSNAAAIGFGIVGAALVATGAVFFYLDAKSSESPRAALVPLLSPGSAGAAALWRF